MSGSSIQLANGSFAVNGLKATLTVPDRTGMLGEYLFGTDGTHSTRNMANNAVPLTPTGAGTPVYNAASILLSGSASYGNGIAGYDTGMSFPSDVTMVVVRKKLASGTLASTTVPWFGSGAYRGLMDYDNWDFYNNQSGVPPAVGKVAEPADTNFHFAAGVGPNAGQGTMYVATGGVITSSTGTTAGAAQAAGSPTIKLCPAGNYQMELAYAAIYNRALSGAEITSLYASLQAYLASRGVTVS